MIGVDRFLQHLKQAKRYSVHTLCAYNNDLQQFGEYLSSTYQVHEVHSSEAFMIRSWLVALMEQKATRTTINRKRSTLQSYFRYSMAQGLIQQNPMEKITSLKKEQRLPVFVEEENLNKLFDQPLFEAGFEGCRDRLIMLLMYTTGMRLSELTGLKTRDVDINQGTLRILGKGNKERILPLLPEVKTLLEEYGRQKQIHFDQPPGHAFLIVTNKGGMLYPKFVYRVVNFYLSKITTIRKRSPHVLRHSFATHMLNHGADLNAIKEILGHANLSATQVYTHNSFSKIKSVYKQAHPKA